jgi:hypothetical protein
VDMFLLPKRVWIVQHIQDIPRSAVHDCRCVDQHQMKRELSVRTGAASSEHQKGKTMTAMQHHQMSGEMQQCITNCLDCHAICVQTIGHCLEMGGEHASKGHITTLQDCAQICAASADFMLRSSPFHAQTCGVCAEVCDACAEECERMAQGDAMMQACAESCRRCAESCRRMAAMAA